jgi:exosortase E/protease (VPEID-CTERM system)
LLQLALLFFLEKVFLDQFVDFTLADTSQGFGASVRSLQHWLFRFIAVFGASILVFSLARRRAPSNETAPVRSAMPRAGWLLVHLLLLAILAGLSHSLYRATTGDLSLALVTGAGIVVGFGVMVAALLALAPGTVWVSDARSLGAAWLYAAIIAGLATSAIGLLQSLWRPASALTFYLVGSLLRPILPALQADPHELILDTGRFAIQVADACSGLEGIGLILGFSTLWLIYFRREYVFPRALWIVPIGMVAMLALNALRIAALLLIGHAGYPDVALFGFHSQAGWITFILGASAVVLLSRRAAFLRPEIDPHDRRAVAPNPTAPYLMPLLSILAVGMLTRAVSGPSEALYPLSVLAGLGALWAYRQTLRQALDWGCTWRGPLCGVIVGVLTITLMHLLSPDLDPLPLETPLGRWLAAGSRCVAALITIPLADELAYRGFLMRRLARLDFEAMPFTAVRWPAIGVSAVVSGAIHGALFIPALIGGIAYGALIMRRGKFGEAVVAHALTNAVVIAAAGPWAAI